MKIIKESIEKKHDELVLEAYERYCKRSIQIDLGVEVVRKIARLLPDGWDWNVDWWGDLSLSKKDDKPTAPLEFHHVINTVARVIGKDPKDISREADTSGGKNVFLRAVLYGRIKEKSICVMVNMGNPSCEITFEEKHIPASTRLIPIVPSECLGMSKEKEKEMRDANS